MHTKKKLFLHIGTPKTGSTTIQHTLYSNRDILKTNGICYPKLYAKNGVAHYQVAMSLTKKLYNLNYHLNFENIIQSYIDQAYDCDSIIISDEFLYTAPFRQLTELYWKQVISNQLDLYDHNYPNLKFQFIKELSHCLKEHFSEIKVILYLRRQDDFLMSIYLEDIRGLGFYKPIDEFNFYKYELDYSQNIALWSNFFGENNLIIKPFGKKEIQPNVLESFGSIIGLTNLTKDGHTEFKNHQFPPQISSYKKILNHYLQNQEQRDRYSNIIVKLNKQHLPHTSNQTLSLLSRTDRMNLINKYKQGNGEIARKYLNYSHDALFSNPLPAHDLQHSNLPELEASQLIHLLTHTLLLQEDHLRKDTYNRITNTKNKLDSRLEQLENQIQNLNKTFEDKLQYEIDTIKLSHAFRAGSILVRTLKKIPGPMLCYRAIRKMQTWLTAFRKKETIPNQAE